MWLFHLDPAISLGTSEGEQTAIRRELCAGSHMIYSRSTMPLVPVVSYPDLATDRPWLPGSELGGVGEQPESLGTTAALDARFLAVAFSVQWCGWPLASAFMLAYLFVCFFLLS